MTTRTKDLIKLSAVALFIGLLSAVMTNFIPKDQAAGIISTWGLVVVMMLTAALCAGAAVNNKLFGVDGVRTENLVRDTLSQVQSGIITGKKWGAAHGLDGERVITLMGEAVAAAHAIRDGKLSIYDATVGVSGKLGLSNAETLYVLGYFIMRFPQHLFISNPNLTPQTNEEAKIEEPQTHS